ncbi:hypothetical protein [Actinomadura madurae]|uniref:hypothetical protein n=1 Tax=Actinomadura madurae TaxID=1993 RepID=UPI0020D227AB|nr:hypothetical protein [Actinomadura madurae]MCQ0006413.1 hypothetical protein [Actinomadura madurae]
MSSFFSTAAAPAPAPAITRTATAARTQRVRDPPPGCPPATIALRPLLRDCFGFGGSGRCAACAQSSVRRPRPCASHDGPYAETAASSRAAR